MDKDKTIQTLNKTAVMPRCSTCKFWTKQTQSSWQTNGICTGLRNDDMVEIEIKTGWDGGYVDFIETDPNFGCVNHNEA